jgi:hypothetical protein
VTLRERYLAKCCGHPSLEVDDGGDAAVVVVDVDGAHHLLALQVPDAQPNPADGVAPAQFHQLRAARVQCPRFLFGSFYFTSFKKKYNIKTHF